MEKAYFIARKSGPAMVRPASPDFLKVPLQRGDGFSAKLHGKSLFHCQKVWSSHGQAGQS